MFNFLDKFPFLKKYFKKDDSSSIAKSRLQLVLIHDRATIPPQLMELLKHDLIEIISRYMIINEEDIVIGLDKKDGTVILAANIPILKIKPDLDSIIKEKEEEPAGLPKIAPRAKHGKLISASRTTRKTRAKYTAYRLARRRVSSRKK